SSASTTTPRPPTSRTSGSTRSSTAARNRRASRPPTATPSTWGRPLAGWRTCSAATRLSRRPAPPPPAPRATPPPAKPTPWTARPTTATTANGPVAIAHNGNLVNAEDLRAELERDGAVFQSSSDTEVILHLLARAEGLTITDRLARALTRVKGAYTILL